MPFTNTPLYGKAITLDLPSNFADASQIRQIPDHQEVYLDAEGYSSIVVELLEYVDKSSDEEAVQYHFADLINESGDATTVVDMSKGVVKSLPSHPLYTLTFIQTPPTLTPNPYPNRKTPDFTFIHLLLLRLKDHGTDIMITINVPHYPGEYEKGEEEQGQETKLMRESIGMRDRVLESLEIREWGLFDGRLEE